MKYIVSDTFYFTDLNITKKIIDLEKIESSIIYYMDDSTSYSEEQLNDFIKNFEEEKPKNIFEKIYLNRFKIIEEYEKLMSQI